MLTDGHTVSSTNTKNETDSNKIRTLELIPSRLQSGMQSEEPRGTADCEQASFLLLGGRWGQQRVHYKCDFRNFALHFGCGGTGVRSTEWERKSQKKLHERNTDSFIGYTRYTTHFPKETRQ